ncbi:MAG: triose-phosphate isomerase [Desulfobacter postgatei]|uniref:Triosephosphate isomerase n=1 Tax=Desulfobacter postgatei TaxID=2293 RepID=A0A2G6MS47_9BACT|nr:MAG: triose-phosphate isomerase [Desulfobacter postgatei]
MKRTPLIAGNWKMYKTGTQAVAAAKQLADLSRAVDGVDIMIAPTALSLPLVAAALGNDCRVRLGAQNIYPGTEGAFTGEVSGQMIRDAGADYVIIGHSERRQYFGETDESVGLKIRAALDSGLIPVMCIGETESQREAGKTFFILDKQISDGLKGLDLGDLGTLILAYEPVWAIGTGKTAGPDQVREVHGFLRDLIREKYTEDLAGKIRILYGGSVKPGNIKDLMQIEDVDGALVGGASLNPEDFNKIIRF